MNLGVLTSLGQSPVCEDQHQQHDPEALSGDDLEKLGRERPSIFPGAWSEIAFCVSIVVSQILTVMDSVLS